VSAVRDVQNCQLNGPNGFVVCCLSVNACTLSPLLTPPSPYHTTPPTNYEYLHTQMMNLMKFAEEQPEGYCVAWLPDGKSFVIRNPDEFTRQVLPKFFKATKFSSFTRKLYRWGFRQVNRGIGPDDPIIFGNEHFQRDNAEEMSKMRSITAASSRKAEAQTIYCGAAGKRSLDAGEAPDHKRVLLDHLLQQKAAMMHSPNMYAAYGACAAPSGAVSLTSALRPSLGLGMVQSHFTGGLPAMMSKHMDIMGQQNNNLLGNYMPQNGNNQGPAFTTTTSTADIVNAAISALRYAS
jgi:HSF-type DNA-binding